MLFAWLVLQVDLGSLVDCLHLPRKFHLVCFIVLLSGSSFDDGVNPSDIIQNGYNSNGPLNLVILCSAEIAFAGINGRKFLVDYESLVNA